MKMQLNKFTSLFTFMGKQRIGSFTSKLFTISMVILFALQVKGQTVFNETFSNLTTVAYGTAINPANFNTLFDNAG